MNRIRALTVTQSMALVFISGFAVALLFALNAISADLRLQSQLRQDRQLLELTVDVTDVARSLQAERAIGSERLVAPGTTLGDEAAEARDQSDQAIQAFRARNTAATRTSIDDTVLRDAIATVTALRRDTDIGAITSAELRRELTRVTHVFIDSLALNSARARSVALAVEIRSAAAMLAAIDAAGQERAIGAEVLSRRAAGIPVSAALIRELDRATAQRETWLSSYALLADGEAQTMLSLLNRSRPAQRFEAAREALRLEAPPQRVANTAIWFSYSDRFITQLRDRQAAKISTMEAVLTQELKVLAQHIRSDAMLLGALFLTFGVLAFMTARQVRRSLKDIIHTVASLSIDARGAVIPDTPQRDLGQITNALRVLRSVQIAQQQQQAAYDKLRRDVDANLAEVLGAAAKGDTRPRMELLGLDAHGAVLARGVNRLLDQLERDRSVVPEREAS